MKIIARINREHFIVQATDNELAKCAGYAFESSMKQPFDVGHEVNVTDAYEHATAIISASRELEEAKQKLQRTINAIEKMQSVLSPKAESIKAKLP